MVSITEAINQKKPLGSALEAGVENISYWQTVTFTKYTRIALPTDGYVFWVKAELISNSALVNAMAVNIGGEVLNQQPKVTVDATNSFDAKGSLHYTTSLSQEEEKTYSTNQIIFTSEQEIEDLNAIGPDEIYIADFEGVRFAFAGRNGFYEQASLWHYVGNALFSDMVTQIIDDPSQFSTSGLLIVSNSLPIWLSFNRWQNVPWAPFNKPNFPIFPAYLVPLNQRPPYASIMIDYATTEAIAAAPTFDNYLSQEQFAKESVRVILYGLNNGAAQDFIEFAVQYASFNPDIIGISNMPIVKDLKQGQVEFQTIAQKKVVEFNVNYYQSRARNIARQTLQQVVVQYIPNAA